jgi:GT2 family glycosyltransferase
MPIYWNAEQLRHAAPIPVRKFTSCLMSVKRSALGKDRFDGDYNGRGEDIDLSWRISERHAIAIAPAARARHMRTPLSRSPESWLTSTLTGYYYLHHRIWNTSAVNRLCFLWLKCGFAAIALGSSLRNRSILPWRAFLAAIQQARAAGYPDLKMRREYT